MRCRSAAKNSDADSPYTARRAGGPPSLLAPIAESASRTHIDSRPLMPAARRSEYLARHQWKSPRRDQSGNITTIGRLTAAGNMLTTIRYDINAPRPPFPRNGAVIATMVRMAPAQRLHLGPLRQKLTNAACRRREYPTAVVMQQIVPGIFQGAEVRHRPPVW